MSVPRQILVSLLIMAIAGVAWIAYARPAFVFGEATAKAEAPGQGPARRFNRAAPIVTAPVEINDDGSEIFAIGTAAAARQVTIYPQVTGVVRAVLFEPGSEVEAGAVLVRLDDDDQQVAVERAAVAHEAAGDSLARLERLSESGNVTEVALVSARTTEQTAAIDLRSAEIELAKRTIVAPFEGVIGLSDVTVGDLVTTGTAIATLADMDSVTVAFEVPERAAGEISLGQAVRATAPALPGMSIEGELSALDNRIDSATRSLKVEATLPNDDDDIRPGMSIHLVLAVEGEPRPAVPSLAIQWDRAGAYVWKVDGDTVTRVPVQVVSRRSGVVTVAADLEADDAVVVEGVLRLREGSEVVDEGTDGDDPEPVATPEAAARASSPAEKG